MTDQNVKPGLKKRKKAVEPSIEDVAAQAAEATPAAEAAHADAEPQAPEEAAPPKRRFESRSVSASPDLEQANAWRSDELSRAPTPKETDEKAPEPSYAPMSEEEMPTTDDFAAMLGDAPMDVREYESGEKVTVSVVGSDPNSVFVSLDARSEGVIDRAELLDKDGNLSVTVGDSVTAYVVSTGGDGVRLSLGLGGGDGAEMLVDAQSQGIPVEGKVSGTNKGGYEVTVLGKRAFCPFSQIDTEGLDPEHHVGQSYNFLIQRVEENGRNIVVSRRALIERERAEQAEETLAKLKPDAIFDGIVTRLADFGAFVDIGGIDGLVHVSELSWARVDHPSEVIKVGDRTRVKVLRIEDTGDTRGPRIGLSIRQLEEDPWTSAIARFQIGGSYPGIVQRLERFGAFVELAPGLDGLLHISEITVGRRLNHPREALTVGDAIEVQILSIDPLKKQVGLSMKALMDDPWAIAASKFAPGTAIQGHVDSVKQFGIFVALDSGISGLIPMSQLPEDEAKNAFNRFRPGTEVEARVLDVDPARRRLTLTRREDSEAHERAAFRDYQQKTEQTGGLGTFADLLKNR